jgi:iron complex outermembrane receptor protein
MRSVFVVSILFFLICSWQNSIAQKVSGRIADDKGEAIIGASVIIKGTKEGAVTDIDGKFEITTQRKPPLTLVVSFLGFNTQEITIKTADQPISAKLKSTEVKLNDANVTGSRISEKQKQAPLTVESIDRIAIKECAQNSFYEALGTLKGVDLTSASIGFTVINTRGFNSTSPVRSLQVIDGVDNQAPGLNFSLGNFLGCSELDVLKVDLIAGASSAYYGPNAFNGVIGMSTRSPFIKPGLEVMSKVGERNLFENAIRWAQVFKNKKGEEKIGYKFNFYIMQADDWEANNMAATPQSVSNERNPGGYDAVNRYGDEYDGAGDRTKFAKTFPGFIITHRTGYLEKDIVDYDTRNIKANAALHYKINQSELILCSSFGAGTTIYQGDNRYSLKDIRYYQNRIEFRKQDKYFIRAYSTNEDAGNSYDAFFTALALQQAAKKDGIWLTDYQSYWNQIKPTLTGLPGFPHPPSPINNPNYSQEYLAYINSINPFLLNNYYDTLVYFHNHARDFADGEGSTVSYAVDFYEPGTARYDSALKSITTTLYGEGGSKFYDKSALYHVQGEYKFTPKVMDIVVGGNYRMYAPDSRGTIFQDTGGVKIKNSEFGVYSGLEKNIKLDGTGRIPDAAVLGLAAGAAIGSAIYLANKDVANEVLAFATFLPALAGVLHGIPSEQKNLKLNLTCRMDKNENFNTVFSPALSAVYSFNEKQIVRFSFSSAVRNPTLSDQYLYYRVTPLVSLVGNIHGFDSLVTIQSLLDKIVDPNNHSLNYFNVKPIQPEEVQTLEIGYRATLLKNLYMDMSAYYSWYKNFIGYKIGADVDYLAAIGQYSINHIYRVAANAVDGVTTRGMSIGLNYYVLKYYVLAGNYSYNLLDRGNSTDPLIPAYNTPENKYNLSLSGRDLDYILFNSIHLHNIGFGINYKWIQGFQYEGSPQFTGFVPSYDLVDAQLSYHVPKIHSTFKIGASNLFDHRAFTVYGGPTVGRLAYASILVELTK